MIGKCNTGGENVTPEVTTQTPIIQNITEALVGKATGANATEDTIFEGYSAYVGQKLVNGKGTKSGLYVWKKYTIPLSISLTMATSNTNPSLITVSSSDIDLSSVDSTFFIGFVGTMTDAIGPYEYTYTFLENNQIKFDSSTGSTYKGTYNYTYTASSKQLSIATSLGANNVVTFDSATQEKQFLDYVVSDNETAYPDGGTQDGYWYEKVVEGITLEMFGCTEFAVDKFTFASLTASTTQLTHSLGKTPKRAFVFSEDYSFGSNYTVIEINGVYNPDASRLEGDLRFGKTSGKSHVTQNTNVATDSAISFVRSGSYSIYYAAGVEYTLITMA